MKAQVLTFCFCIGILCFGTAEADNLVLKSGKIIIADKIWAEDDLIKCERFESVLSFPKSQVERIEIKERQPDRRPLSPPQEISNTNVRNTDARNTEIDTLIVVKSDRDSIPFTPFLPLPAGEKKEQKMNSAQANIPAMTIQDLIKKVEQIRPGFLLLFFVFPPLIVLILSFSLMEGTGERFPYNLLYSALVYTVALPGILSATLTAYAIFILKQNLLEVNVFVYFLPIISMIVTLALVGRDVSWQKLPGVDRLYALMVIIAVSFGITLVIQRTRIFIFFGGSIGSLLYIALACIVIIKAAMYMLFRKKRNGKTGF